MKSQHQVLSTAIWCSISGIITFISIFIIIAQGNSSSGAEKSLWCLKILLIYMTFHIRGAFIDNIYNLLVSDKGIFYLKYKFYPW